MTPDGEGQVMRSDPVRKVVQVKLRESDCTREFPAEEVDRL